MADQRDDTPRMARAAGGAVWSQRIRGASAWRVGHIIAVLVLLCLELSAEAPSLARPRARHSRAVLGTELLKAASDADARKVKALLARGATVDARDKEGWTPLIHAARMCDATSIRVILRAGANVNARGRDGETALWAASGGGDSVRLVRLLLDHGARVNARTKWHSSALQFAAEMGDLPTVRLLVARGANLRTQGGGAIGQAVFRGRTDVVRFLLDKGVRADRRNLSTGSEPDHIDHHWSLLMMAIKRGNTDIAELLIARGANVNVRSRMGVTALKLADRDGDDELVRRLKRAGARR